jgi:hypothetical protein
MRKLPAAIKVEPKFIDNMDSEYITIRLSRKGVRRTLRAAAAILVAFILIVPGLHFAKQYDVPTRIEAGFHQLYEHMLEIDLKSSMESLVPAQDEGVKSPVIQEVKPMPVKTEKPQTPAPAKLTEQQAETPVAAPAAKKAEEPAAAKAMPKSGTWCIVMASSTTESLAGAFIKRLEKMGVHGAMAIPERKAWCVSSSPDSPRKTPPFSERANCVIWTTISTTSGQIKSNETPPPYLPCPL